MLTQQKLVEAALQDVAKLRARDFAGSDDAVYDCSTPMQTLIPWQITCGEISRLTIASRM